MSMLLLRSFVFALATDESSFGLHHIAFVNALSSFSSTDRYYFKIGSRFFCVFVD
jgi:hypothetical protein